jgi:hypothetical protein
LPIAASSKWQPIAQLRQRLAADLRDHCQRLRDRARDPAARIGRAHRAVFMIAKTLAPENGVKPFVIMVARRGGWGHDGGSKLGVLALRGYRTRLRRARRVSPGASGCARGCVEGGPLTRWVIENSVRDIPDGLVHLIGGVADLGARGVIAYESQRGLQVLARGAQSADHDVVQASGDPFAVFGLARDGFGGAGGGAVFGRWRETGGRPYRGDGRCAFRGRCGQNTWYPVHRGGSLSL